jgi:tripartite-type tricarboxylate transporter receptor subunit TctC
MSISARRKSAIESRPAVSKVQRRQRRPVQTAILRVHPFGMNAAELARRKFLRLAAGAAALPALPSTAMAQAYPTRPITMIVPFPAGGGGDVIARIIAEPMRSSLEQPIIIENVSGAGGSVGVGRAARARPDGYTLDLGATSSHVLNGAFYSLQYDLLNDFAAISPLATTPFVLFGNYSPLCDGLTRV